jgi:Lrp/AsnC family leucine-responsive transcriptional regulator
MKRLRFKNGPVDEVDVALIRALSEDARTTMAELARSVGLSAPSVAERVRRLEEAGVIRGYGARIDPAALGLPLAVYVRVRPMPGQLRKTVEVLSAIDAVVECDRVTGEDCFIAKVHVRSVEELEAVIDRMIPYAMTNTSIIQSKPVSRRLPPLPAR